MGSGGAVPAATGAAGPGAVASTSGVWPAVNERARSSVVGASDSRRSGLGVLCVVCAMITLGLAIWQGVRAIEKQRIEATIAATADAALAIDAGALADRLWHRVRITGTADLERHWLLDNRTLDGQVGYELYRLLWLSASQALLVADGFVPAGDDRDTLPDVPVLWGGAFPDQGSRIEVVGTLMPPEGNLVWRHDPAALDAQRAATLARWPRRVQKIDAAQLEAQLSRGRGAPVQVAPVVLVNERSPRRSSRRSVRMGSATHLGYAVQWLGLTIVMITGAVIAFRRRCTGA